MMSVPLSLVFTHWLGDFALQNDWMAVNKAKSWKALLVHVIIVTFCVEMWAFLFLPEWNYTWNLGIWTGLNFVAHFVTDAVTSRINSKLWFIGLREMKGRMAWPPGEKWTHYARMQGSRHWFFVSVGFDQFLHYAAYALILRYLL